MSVNQCRDLVLVHGWGMSAGVWEALPAALPGGIETYAVELPGHGRHGLAPPCDRDQGLLDAWAGACLDRAPDRAIWLGWSLGGLVALAAALRAPSRVQALILMTATPRFVRSVDWTPAMPEETLNGFHDALLADPMGTLDRFLSLQIRGGDRPRETLRVLRHALAARPAPDARALALGLDLLREEDLRGPLPDLVPPSLWLFGARDTLVPAAVAERVEMLVPGARTQVIPGAAHAPFLSHPAETATAIGGFLSEVCD